MCLLLWHKHDSYNIYLKNSKNLLQLKNAIGLSKPALGNRHESGDQLNGTSLQPTLVMPG